MDYQKIYDGIIDKAKSENRKKGQGTYYELHHIIPKCMGGGEEKPNKILLTAKEHFVCHKLLFRIHPTNCKLALAYHSMAYTMQDKRKIRITSREYEELRVFISINTSGENSIFFNKRQSEEQLKKLSKARRGRPSRNKGVPMSDEQKIKLKKTKSEEHKDKLRKYHTGRKASQRTKDAMSESHKGERNAFYNKRHSEESIKKQSDAKIGSKNPFFNKKQKPESILKAKETKKNRTQIQKDEEKRKRREANLGENNPNYGKKQSEEVIAKRVEGIKLYWERVNQEKLMMIF